MSDVRTVSVFLALLAVTAEATVIAAAVLVVASRWSPGAAALRDRLAGAACDAVAELTWERAAEQAYAVLREAAGS